MVNHALTMSGRHIARGEHALVNRARGAVAAFGFDRLREKFVDQLQDAHPAVNKVDAPKHVVADEAIAGEARELAVVERWKTRADDVVGRSRERGLRAEADGIGRRDRHIAAAAIKREAAPLPRAFIVDEHAGSLEDELH
jgi:hypothetical protein